MKKIPRAAALVLTITLLLSLCGCGAADGKTHLTFQIWDVAQRDGMQAMCDAYTAQNPGMVLLSPAASSLVQYSLQLVT